LTTDGEQKNIEAMMQEKSLQLMSDHQIIVRKHSAFMSARGNDLDAGNSVNQSNKEKNQAHTSEFCPEQCASIEESVD
jgi:hypothetical protein